MVQRHFCFLTTCNLFSALFTTFLLNWNLRALLYPFPQIFYQIDVWTLRWSPWVFLNQPILYYFRCVLGVIILLEYYFIYLRSKNLLVHFSIHIVFEFSNWYSPKPVRQPHMLILPPPCCILILISSDQITLIQSIFNSFNIFVVRQPAYFICVTLAEQSFYSMTCQCLALKSPGLNKLSLRN